MAKTLRVIDISSNNGDVKQGKIDYDAVIIKATEGKTYVNPYCDSEFQEAYKLGKKLGVYHFARNTNNSATDEANFFIKQTKGYIGKAIPVLDWEDKDTSDVTWALKWLQIVEKEYGCKPMIYMSESVVNRYNWSKVANGNYGLWCAKYRDYIADYDWNMASAGAAPSVKYWETIALWQWTSAGRLDGHSGNLDCSIFYGDEAAWDKYVGKGGSGQTSSSSSSNSINSSGTSVKTTNYKVKINTPSGVNVRSSMDSSSKKNILIAIPNGETVTITKESSGWGYTSYKGKKGWISLKYTKKVNSGSSSSSSSKFNKSDWIRRLQKECNNQGFSNQKVDGKEGPNTLAGCPLVKEGASGGITKLIQEYLIAHGYSCGSTGADGKFGSKTAAAVRAYQKDHSLTVDGDVGPKTWASFLGL